MGTELTPQQKQLLSNIKDEKEMLAQKARFKRENEFNKKTNEKWLN